MTAVGVFIILAVGLAGGAIVWLVSIVIEHGRRIAALEKQLSSGRAPPLPDPSSEAPPQ